MELIEAIIWEVEYAVIETPRRKDRTNLQTLRRTTGHPSVCPLWSRAIFQTDDLKRATNTSELSRLGKGLRNKTESRRGRANDQRTLKEEIRGMRMHRVKIFLLLISPMILILFILT